MAVSAPVISALQTAQQMKQAASQTSDKRVQAQAGGATALAAVNNYDAVKTDPKNADGKPLTDQQRQELATEAETLKAEWGPGGTYRQITTALTEGVGVGGKVTGGVTGLLQDATVAYLQELGASTGMTWKVYEYKRMSGGESNWVIKPEFISEIDEAECPSSQSVFDYIENKYPDLGKKAHKDLVHLVEHLKSWLENHGYQPVYYQAE